MKHQIWVGVYLFLCVKGEKLTNKSLYNPPIKLNFQETDGANIDETIHTIEKNHSSDYFIDENTIPWFKVSSNGNIHVTRKWDCNEIDCSQEFTFEVIVKNFEKESFGK